MLSFIRSDTEEYIIKRGASINNINRIKFEFIRGNYDSGCFSDYNVSFRVSLSTIPCNLSGSDGIIHTGRGDQYEYNMTWIIHNTIDFYKVRGSGFWAIFSYLYFGKVSWSGVLNKISSSILQVRAVSIGNRSTNYTSQLKSSLGGWSYSSDKQYSLQVLMIEKITNQTF